jgi:hypothetical protein
VRKGKASQYRHYKAVQISSPDNVYALTIVLDAGFFFAPTFFALVAECCWDSFAGEAGGVPFAAVETAFFMISGS